jgi:hypothetical protein
VDFDIALIQAAFEDTLMRKHIRESNEIEGIYRDPSDAEVEEWKRFMALDEIQIDDLKRFVYVYAGAGHRLRNLITDAHYIGKRTLTGGSQVTFDLAILLQMINHDDINPWHAHVEYEYLHPFTDGNGRSGRMLWHWMMKRKYGGSYESMTSIGFLQRFYYQAMQYYNL